MPIGIAVGIIVLTIVLIVRKNKKRRHSVDGDDIAFTFMMELIGISLVIGIPTWGIVCYVETTTSRTDKVYIEEVNIAYVDGEATYNMVTTRTDGATVYDNFPVGSMRVVDEPSNVHPYYVSANRVFDVPWFWPWRVESFVTYELHVDTSSIK